MDNQTLNALLDNLKSYFDTLNSLDFDLAKEKNNKVIRNIEASISLIKCSTQCLDNVVNACPERIISNLKLVLTGEKSKHFFEYVIYPEFDYLACLCRNGISHGGARKGAGRKAKRPTTQIRIDKDLAESFKMMSDYYQLLDDNERRDFDNRFSTSGLLFPNG